MTNRGKCLAVWRKRNGTDGTASFELGPHLPGSRIPQLDGIGFFSPRGQRLAVRGKCHGPEDWSGRSLQGSRLLSVLQIPQLKRSVGIPRSQSLTDGGKRNELPLTDSVLSGGKVPELDAAIITCRSKYFPIEGEHH